MDVYSLELSMAQVVAYLETHDKKLAAIVKQQYACFGRLEPQTYGAMVESGRIEGCTKAATDACVAVAQKRQEFLKIDTAQKSGADVDLADPCIADDAFINELNTHVIVSAEQYYRSMFCPDTSSWNVRDRHFFSQAKRVREHLIKTRNTIDNEGVLHERDGIVIFAHNSHIGNARYTHLERKAAARAEAAAAALPLSSVKKESQKQQSRYQRGGGGGIQEEELNIGQLFKDEFGDEAVIVGQITNHGSVAASDDWGSPMKIKAVRRGLTNSYEDLLHSVATTALPQSDEKMATIPAQSQPSDEIRETDEDSNANFILDLQKSAPNAKMLAGILKHPRLERCIGVIYRPDTERQSHYFSCNIYDQFDIVIYFDRSSAVKALTEKHHHAFKLKPGYK
jgi:erythromycin esterase-like protein